MYIFKKDNLDLNITIENFCKLLGGIINET